MRGARAATARGGIDGRSEPARWLRRALGRLRGGLAPGLILEGCWAVRRRGRWCVILVAHQPVRGRPGVRIGATRLHGTGTSRDPGCRISSVPRGLDALGLALVEAVADLAETSGLGLSACGGGRAARQAVLARLPDGGGEGRSSRM